MIRRLLLLGLLSLVAPILLTAGGSQHSLAAPPLGPGSVPATATPPGS